MQEELKELEGDQGQVAQEQLGSMRTVKSFGAEQHAKSLYGETTQGTYKQQRKIAIFEAKLNLKSPHRARHSTTDRLTANHDPLLQAVMNGVAMDLGWPSVILACFWVGAPQTIHDPDFRADFVSFVIIANGAINQLEKCFEAVPQFAKAIGASCKIFDVFDHASGVPYTGGRRLPDLKGEIEVTNLHFGYVKPPKKKKKQDKSSEADAGEEQEEEVDVVFQGLDLKVSPGQHVALVGPSGSGKSTLVAMLMRFYDPSEGSITIDGVDLRELDPQWLRQQVSTLYTIPATPPSVPCIPSDLCTSSLSPIDARRVRACVCYTVTGGDGDAGAGPLLWHCDREHRLRSRRCAPREGRRGSYVGQRT